MEGNDIGFNLQDFAPAIGKVERFMSSMSSVASSVKSFSTNGLDLNGAEKEIEGISSNLSNLVDSSSEISEIRSSLINMLMILDEKDFKKIFEDSEYFIDLDYYLAPFFPNMTYEKGGYTLGSKEANYYYYDKEGNLCGKYYGFNHLYIDCSDPDNIKYQRWNPESHSFSAISIFDDENLITVGWDWETPQYGASQMAFAQNFDNLIEDPLIWEEMQKYYPVNSFKSEDDAMEFYEEYFKTICNTGCGYAAAADLVFKSFEGKEKEFEEIFGYPMYTVNYMGMIDFNYELFELGHFNYNNHLDNRKLLIGSELDTYDNMYEEAQELYDMYNTTSSLRFMKRNMIKSEYMKLYEELSDFDDIYKHPSADSGENGKVGHFDEYLKTFGIDTSFSHIESNKNLNNIVNIENGIVSSSGFDLLNMDGSISYEDVEGHYMFITGKTEDDDLIVSSWGKKFILKLDNSDYVNVDIFEVNN